jgi:tRNA(fMet)-specific endonuclease VapC
LEVILDTNAISAFAGSEKSAMDIFQTQSRLFLPVIVIGEYRFGLLKSREKLKREAWFDLLIEMLEILEIKVETTRYYAKIRKDLESVGRPIPHNDVWIAALALEHDLPVISRDTHFDEVENLQRISW